MDYTVTINLFYVLGLAFFAVLMYIYIKDDGDDRLTHLRHDIEMKKEWFKMLAAQNKQKAKNNKRA